MPATALAVREGFDLIRSDLHSNVESDMGRLDDIIASSGRRLSKRGRSDPEYLTRLGEAAGFLADVLDGRTDPYHLKEALSTSDFSILMGDILDRQLLGRYQEIQPTYRNSATSGPCGGWRSMAWRGGTTRPTTGRR
jgi:hypothetical protein